jgi:hypothetical protein
LPFLPGFLEEFYRPPVEHGSGDHGSFQIVADGIVKPDFTGCFAVFPFFYPVPFLRRELSGSPFDREEVDFRAVHLVDLIERIYKRFFLAAA